MIEPNLSDEQTGGSGQRVQLQRLGCAENFKLVAQELFGFHCLLFRGAEYSLIPSKYPKFFLN